MWSEDARSVATSRGGPLGDHGSVQQNDPVGRFERLVKVVGGIDDRLASRGQPMQHLDNDLLGGNIDSGEGLIEKIDIAVLQSTRAPGKLAVADRRRGG